MNVVRALIPAALVLTMACQTTQQPAPSTQPGTQTAASSNRLTPTTRAARTIAAPWIRVGLISDKTENSFPRIPEGYFVVSEAGPSTLRRGFTVYAPVSETALRYAVQVAALSDRESADRFAEKIRTETGERADLLFDAGGGVYKVLVGSVESEDAARPLRERLTTGGYGTGMLIVRRPSDEPFRKTLRLVDDEGDSYNIDSSSLLILPATAETISIDGRPFRGAARVFINNRGLLNVINELNLEDYVRGVVPNEMGPKVFDEVEALKAQALAARTYAIRRMGDFEAEGYDICPTPACQVYNGFSTEDALSDQAVKDTAGMIITHNGAPIDALYTSTCGGETSDVEVMFPGRNDPWLRRVRCVEMEMTELRGRTDGTMLNEMQAHGAIFAAAAGLTETGSWSATEVARAVSAAARLAGATMDNSARPASSRRGDVLAYLARVWGFDAYGRTLTMPEDRKYFFPRTSGENPVQLAAAFLIKYGIQPSQYIDFENLDAAMPRDELYAMLYSWLREHEALVEASGKIFRLSGRQMTLKSAGKTTDLTLPAGVPVFRRLGDRYLEYSNAPVMIGDQASVLSAHRGQPLAIILQANYDGASFDRTSSFANWTRSYRADDLTTSIARRNPIQTLRDLKILGTDLSQRVTALEVTADSGRTFTLKGLPIRWSLNLPDNLFVFRKTQDPDGMARYTFFGKGWGHGVGMCQVGAYGMAFRGSKAEEIVMHFYTGVEVVKAK